MLTSQTIPESEVKPLHHVEVESGESIKSALTGVTFPRYSDALASMQQVARMIQRVGFSMEDVRKAFRSRKIPW